jgi:excisionase family DNA binding protein
MRLMTTAEAADYLRLKERKLYELVSNGAIPCTKITGRWLFPQHELDRWLADSLVRPEGMAERDPPPIVGGSHDGLLEWALRESGSGLATLPEGSEAGLARFRRGELMAAGIHLHALKDASVDANVQAMQAVTGPHDAVLVGFVRREVGFLTAPGNPLRIAHIGDVLERRARLATRPAGAGAQLLLHALLHRAGSSAARPVLVNPPCPTGPDVAQAIRAGRADCGIAVRAVAATAGLDFVPILWERFDLAGTAQVRFAP